MAEEDDKVAHGLLAQGILPGDRVALLFTNSLELVFCYFACFKSGAVTLGYWNDPDNTRAALKNGGMHSGDLARRDADGFLWFAGRAKDIIIRGGSNISPGEVEDVLYAHPAVYEAGVVGVPCREMGQRVRAYVALKPGASATERELIDWAAKSIAAYKVPETVLFLATLPKGLTGKVLRKALRDQASGA